MEAVILAGGFGTRLRPLTLTRPKPLLPIANVPMVQRILDRLPPQVDRAILAAGYRVDQLREFAEALDHRVDLVVVDEDEPLGTGGAMKNVEDEITGPFLAFNGDVISSCPLDRLAELQADRNALGVLALWQVEDPSEFGVARLDGDRIVEFVEKPPAGQAPSDLINAGMYCFDPEILDRVPPREKVSIERDVWPAVIEEGHDLLGMRFDGHWIDCGRPADYLEAHRVLIDDGPVIGPGAECLGTVTGFASLGRAARIDAAATIEDAVLLEEARVEGNAVVTNSILGSATVIEPGAVVQDSVIGDGARVPAGATIKDERIDPNEVASHG